jgi:hypothetical protein
MFEGRQDGRVCNAYTVAIVLEVSSLRTRAMWSNGYHVLGTALLYTTP